MPPDNARGSRLRRSLFCPPPAASTETIAMALTELSSRKSECKIFDVPGRLARQPLNTNKNYELSEVGFILLLFNKNVVFHCKNVLD